MKLNIKLQRRFPDLGIKPKEINIFQNQFSCDIEKLPPTLQMETIDIQSNAALKVKYHEKTLVNLVNFINFCQIHNVQI